MSLLRHIGITDDGDVELQPASERIIGRETPPIARIKVKDRHVGLGRAELERLVDAGLEALALGPLVTVERIRERVKDLA